MDQFFNTARKMILVKDMSDFIDFEKINKEFDTLDFGPNTLNLISNDKFLFNREGFENIKQVLEGECESFLRNGHGCDNFEHLAMSNSWANITHPGDSHHEHSHPFSIVSGVLYLDDNPDNLNLTLDTHIAEIPYFLFKKTAYVSLKALVGEGNNLKNHLVLFLSNTGHSVESTSIDSTPRRSVAFNTFWKGVTGSPSAELGSFKF